ncbi:hypothetical protein GCM10020229_55270 [Kitasatospora albolonga]|uniref:hypothetical protein n=1 Tax=Kitasatospora albolonga TaxID=68173 RepID=UPI0031EC0E1A
MLNPLDAPEAVLAAAEPLEELLDDCNHVSSVELYPVFPAGGMTAGQLGEAVGPVRWFERPEEWREVFLGAVSKGFMQPVARYGDPGLRTPEELRRTGELAEGIADLIEAHLGPVRRCGDVGNARVGQIWWRSLLVVTEEWAGVLHLEVFD